MSIGPDVGIFVQKIKIIIGLLAFVLTTQAHSTIIGLEKRSYLTSYDSLITFDQSTGLEWLSPTFTQGLSMLEVEANASIWADGWQWATIDQMWTMLDRANTPAVHPDDIYAAYEVAEFLGPTYTSISPGEGIHKKVYGYSRGFLVDTELYEDGYDYSTAAITGWISLDTSDPNYPWPNWSYCEDGINERCGDFRMPGWKETDTHPYSGAWLIRDASVPVSEPSILGLIVLGIAGIGFTRKRKS